MRTWRAPLVTPLPGSGIGPRLYDTRSGRVSPVRPITPGLIRLYICGITPYDATHMGHAMTYHAADLMHRVFLDAGWQVQAAQNITDVDDPLFERAERDQQDWRELASSQIDLFARDMQALRIIPPQTYDAVSEAMDRIIATAQDLYARGRLYCVPNEDVTGVDWYQDLRIDQAQDSVSGWSREQMLEVYAERGGDPHRSGKRDPLDPLVWKAQRPGEPAWDAGVLGTGRPGWHVECVCIAHHGLGLPFDVQAGGRDLIFPHHDLSAAHAAALGRPLASCYAHVGMVALDGTKMSKSLGNLEFVSRLVEQGTDPAAIRLVLLEHHYRTDWEWTAAALERAVERLARYRQAAQCHPRNAAVVAALRDALRDDLDTPRALRLLDEWVCGEESENLGMNVPVDPDVDDVAAAVDALLGIALH